MWAGVAQVATAPSDTGLIALEQEVARFRDALDLIHGSAPYMDFSVNVIRQLHSTINRYMPDSGVQWKMAENDIVERNSDGSFRRTRFKTVSPVATPQAMEDLVGRYKEVVHDHRKEPLVVIQLAILDFLCIHPFGDGNGRVSRLLTLLLLYHFDYLVGRYIGLDRIFEDSKEKKVKKGVFLESKFNVAYSKSFNVPYCKSFHVADRQ